MKILLHSAKVALLLAALAAAGVYAPAAEVAPPIPDGVVVAGVEIGGLTSVPARRELSASLSRRLVVGYRHSRWSVDPAALGARADVGRAVVAALRAGRAGAVPLAVDVDAAKVKRFAERLARRLHRPARDARLLGLDAQLRPRFAAAATGRRVRVGALAVAIERALRENRRETIDVPWVKLRPRVTTRDFGPLIVIRRESNVLDLYDARRLVRQFRVATGTEQYPTPLGWFTIVDKQYHPWWYPPASDWARGLDPIPPGPSNPLGTRWMGLDVYGVGIHGTPSAASIGYSASHGCIRMHIPEAEWLFERVRHGTPVFIVSA